MYGARGLRRAACVPAPPAAANTSVAVVLGGSMKPYSWWMNANRYGCRPAGDGEVPIRRD